MSTRPDTDKILTDLSDCSVELANDPVAAGAALYISEKLREIRDKSELLSNHLTGSQLWLADVMNLLSTAQKLYKVKKREGLVAVTPSSKKGRSQTMIEAGIEIAPDMLKIESEIADHQQEKVLWETLVNLLQGKQGDLKRANSDIRLQAQVCQQGYGNAGIVGGPSEWAKQHNRSPEGDAVDADSV